MSLSRKVVAACLTTVGALALHQYYLSQHDTQSPYYWRNLHTFSDIVFQTAHYKHVDHLLSMSKVIAAADLDATQFINFICAIPKARILKKLFDKLDDIVDGSKAEAVIALGDATLGTQLSPFLIKLLSKDDLHTLNQFVSDDLITQDELYSFGNLFANKLYNQAKLTLQYNKEQDPKQRAVIRKKIALENVEISGCYMALCIHFIKKDPKLAEMMSSPTHTGMTYDDVKSVYYRSAKAGELMQIAHDTPEFRYDLKNEPEIGKISANYFLAELEAADALHENKEALEKLPDRPVNVNELPAKIQTVLQNTEHCFEDAARELGPSVKVVYSLAWQYEKCVGFFAQKPRHHSAADNVVILQPN